MNIEDILKSKELIEYLKEYIEISEEDIRNNRNFHGCFLSALIYDFIHEENAVENYHSSDKSITDAFSLNCNFMQVQYSCNKEEVIYSDEYIYFLKNKQIDLASYICFSPRVLNNLICGNQIFTNCGSNIEIIISYYKHESFSFHDRELYPSLEKYYNIERKLNDRGGQYYEYSIKNKVLLFSENFYIFEESFEQYILLTRSKKNIKNTWLEICKYYHLTKSCFFSSNLGNGFYVFNENTYEVKKTSCLDYVNNYLNKLPNNKDKEGNIEYKKYLPLLNKLFEDHPEITSNFEVTLAEQIKRYKVIQKHITNQKNSLSVIGLLENELYNNYVVESVARNKRNNVDNSNILSFTKWVNNLIKNFISSSEELIIEPLPIKDKYLGCQIVQLCSKLTLIDEGFYNHHCVGGYYSKLSEDLRIFSIRYDKHRFTCEFKYYKNYKSTKYKWELTQCRSYANASLSSYNEKIRRKIQLCIDYIIEQLNILYNPQKSKDIL